MRAVVDLGCMERNGANSVLALARRYRPCFIYAFDPSPLLVEGVRKVWKQEVAFQRRAAWLHSGTVSFWEDGSGSRIGHGGPDVACFDFSYWLSLLHGYGNDDVIVKMDVEGAEVPLLERMMADGTDQLVSELLVEWHGENTEEHERIEKQLACPVRRWWL